MFPDKCGAELALSFALGGDSSQVVPDHFVVVRGGLKQVPDAGTIFIYGSRGDSRGSLLCSSTWKCS